VGAAVYATRKIVVEPVFGQIKQARGFRQFLDRFPSIRSLYELELKSLSQRRTNESPERFKVIDHQYSKMSHCGHLTFTKPTLTGQAAPARFQFSEFIRPLTHPTFEGVLAAR
jgi:hypothetical protein